MLTMGANQNASKRFRAYLAPEKFAEARRANQRPSLPRMSGHSTSPSQLDHVTLQLALVNPRHLGEKCAKSESLFLFFLLFYSTRTNKGLLTSCICKAKARLNFFYPPSPTCTPQPIHRGLCLFISDLHGPIISPHSTQNPIELGVRSGLLGDLLHVSVLSPH